MTLWLGLAFSHKHCLPVFQASSSGTATAATKPILPSCTPRTVEQADTGQYCRSACVGARGDERQRPQRARLRTLLDFHRVVDHVSKHLKGVMCHSA